LLYNIKSLKVKIISLLFVLMVILATILTAVSIDNIDGLVDSNLDYISESMVKKEKKELKNKIDLVSNIIELYYKKTTPQYMQSVVKQALVTHQEQLFNQLNHIYMDNKECMSEKALKERLKEIVQYARYAKNGYFWINDMQCRMIMHPIKPEYDGRVFLKAPKVPFVKLGVDSLKKEHKDRAFISYKFYNPATKKYELKVSLVRIFKPYHWVIGTGKYLSDITPLIKQQLLANIEALRYGKSGYFWINDMHYRMIMHPIKPEYDKRFFIDTPKVPFVKLGVDALKNSQNNIAYLRYKFYNPATNKYEDKLSIVKLFKPWNWVIGTGVYLDTIDESIESIKVQKNHEEKNLIHKILFITLLMIIITLLFAYILTVKFIIDPMTNLTSEKNHFKEIANIDYLTQILNRRAFFAGVQEFAKNNECKLGVCILDIDFFKNVNDTYGHDAGDEVLKQIAMFVQNSLRGEDLFGRIGGEEFAVCVLNTDSKQLQKLATKIKERIEKSTIIYKEMSIECTLSIGCYEFDPKVESVREAFVKADKALYLAKEQGRNRVVVF